MRLLYLCLAHCLLPIAFLRELWRAFRHPEYRAGLTARLGCGARLAPGALWVHAVSVGEVQAAGPLLRRLAAEYPARPLVLTVATATGRVRALVLYGSIAQVRYLPYDVPVCVWRFLDRVTPTVGVILETELWPTLYRACERRQIPLLVASARLSERSVRRYRRMPRFTAQLLGAPHVSVAAQTATDAARFQALGAVPARTCVVGNVKYDQSVPVAERAQASARRATLGIGRPIWVAGSTHEGEESVVLEAHRTVLARFPNALLVLAPRHPPRFETVAQWLGHSGLSFVRRSQATEVSPQAAVFLLDTLGELVGYYAAADIAFVGGSLVPIGGHNLLEPLSVQCPVLPGPSTENDAATAAWLVAAGALRTVVDATTLAEAVIARCTDPAAGRVAVAAGMAVLDANRGAVERVLATLRPLIGRADRFSGR